MGQFSKIRLPQGQAWRAAVIVSVVLVLLVGTLVALNLTLTGTGRLKDLAAVIQSVVTAFALIAGGIFAAYKWQVFRESEPHLTVDNKVSHRRDRVHTRGMAPKVRPPKAWDSSKPPGGKLPPARKPKPSG